MCSSRDQGGPCSAQAYGAINRNLSRSVLLVPPAVLQPTPRSLTGSVESAILSRSSTSSCAKSSVTPLAGFLCHADTRAAPAENSLAAADHHTAPRHVALRICSSPDPPQNHGSASLRSVSEAQPGREQAPLIDLERNDSSEAARGVHGSCGKYDGGSSVTSVAGGGAAGAAEHPEDIGTSTIDVRRPCSSFRFPGTMCMFLRRMDNVECAAVRALRCIIAMPAAAA